MKLDYKKTMALNGYLNHMIIPKIKNEDTKERAFLKLKEAQQTLPYLKEIDHDTLYELFNRRYVYHLYLDHVEDMVRTAFLEVFKRFNEKPYYKLERDIKNQLVERYYNDKSKELYKLCEQTQAVSTSFERDLYNVLEHDKLPVTVVLDHNLTRTQNAFYRLNELLLNEKEIKEKDIPFVIRLFIKNEETKQEFFKGLREISTVTDTYELSVTTTMSLKQLYATLNGQTFNVKKHDHIQFLDAVNGAVSEPVEIQTPYVMLKLDNTDKKHTPLLLEYDTFLLDLEDPNFWANYTISELL